jgi:pimeloyl-ACP methyl ester carboxylesterase
MDTVEFAASRKSVTTPSGRVHYAEKGRGPMAVFLHGVLVNGYMWRHQLDVLSDLRRCVAVDLLGHGHTEIGVTQDVSSEAQATMLAELLDGLHGAGAGAVTGAGVRADVDADQIDLVGSGSGTGIAQLFAARYPERVRSLTLTNGDVHDRWPPDALADFFALVTNDAFPTTIARMAADKNRFRADDVLGPAYEYPRKVTDETIDAFLQPLVSSPLKINDLRRFVSAFDSAQTVRAEPRLQALQVPTLIVWGTGDPCYDVSGAHWLAETIPGTRRRVELDGAHLQFPEERADELNEELRAHWTAATA